MVHGTSRPGEQGAVALEEAWLGRVPTPGDSKHARCHWVPPQGLVAGGPTGGADQVDGMGRGGAWPVKSVPGGGLAGYGPY